MNDLKDYFGGKKEVVDGVTIVHSGYVQLNGTKIERSGRDNVEMYDANGNRFYHNFDSIEEAKKEVERLTKEGVNAVIGPKAPMYNYNFENNTEQYVPNCSETAVGVYIIQVPEKIGSSYKSR